MKLKKALPTVQQVDMTQFVADIPTESVIRVLNSFPRFDLKAVSSPLGLFTVEVRFSDSDKNVPIYLSLQPWNQTETLVTLSYDQPTSSTSTITQTGQSTLSLFGGTMIAILGGRFIRTVLLTGLFAVIIYATALAFSIVSSNELMLTIGLLIVIMEGVSYLGLLTLNLASPGSLAKVAPPIANIGESYQFDSKKSRLQENLMNDIVSQLHNSAELDIVQR